ncbi:MAG: hypothetical protein V4696_03775 [Pseudomonadota bacterium]
MTVQIADSIANAMLDSWESAIGTTPKLRIRTGAPPANVAAASTGTILVEIDLPSDWMAAAAARSKAAQGSWVDAAANNPGTAGHYEIVKADGTTRQEQGTVTATGGGGDMTIDNVVIAVGQQVTVTSFTRSMPNNA